MSTGVVIRLKNLPVTAGTIDIRRYFGGLSIPDGGVHIIGGDDGTAFILFSTDEDARQAMMRDSEKIVGEKIKLMLSSHTEMRTMIEENQRKYEELRGLRPPEPPITNLTSRSSATGSNVAKNQSLDPDVNDVYVELKGMPFNVSEQEIVDFFQNMPISAIRFMLDDKGRQSGQGFVRFRSLESKILALKKDRDFLGPRFVRVVSATEKQWLVAGSQMCDTVRPGGGSSGNDYANRKRGQSSTPSNEGTPKRSRALSPIRCDNCVELRGLPAMSTYKTVQELFYHLKFVENGLYLEMEGKHCRGRAFAEFTTMEEYRDALLKDGEILEGKQIRVISISRQAMVEQVKQHKRYVKLKREEEYKREREELERKEQEKRQQADMYEEQKRKDDEEQRKRREYQLKKQREMEVWLARQHEKEEAERKRQDMDKRLQEQRRMQAAEEERARREAEQKRRREQELRKKEEEQEEIRREYERKRQLELEKIELRIKEEEKLRMKQEILKQELENMNGNTREVEMDLEDQTQTPPKDDFSEDYPPPPSDALLPVKPPPPHYSVANNDSDYSSYSRSPTRRSSRPPEQSFSTPPPSGPAYSSMPYPPRRFTPPPPLPSSERPPMVPPPAAVITARPPPHLPAALPPPPLPPTIGINPPLRVIGDPLYPPRLGAPVEPIVMPMAPATIVPIPPPIIAPVGPPPLAHESNSNIRIPAVYVRVANAPFTVQENQMRGFFSGLHIPPNGVEFVTKNNKRAGHVFIKFATEADAALACKRDKTRLQGRELLVQASNPAQITQLLKKFGSKTFEEIFGGSGASSAPMTPSRPPQRDNFNMEAKIMQEKLTCVRLANVPPTAILEDILRAFTGISVMPNGVHIIRNQDGICNGSAFVELVTQEDCVRAANLHATATVNGVLIRVMPVKHLDMDREITDNNAKVFGHPPPGPLPPPALPPRSDVPIRIPPPPLPMMIPPGARLPPPPLPGREMDMYELRDPSRPPLPPRGRSPTPPHMKNYRPPSPRGPPGRQRSPPPRGPPPIGRPPSPPMRPRSPHLLPPRDISHEEMARRAELDNINRRIDHERAMMRDLRGPYGDRPRFPMDGPRPHMDFPHRFDRPPFPGERPRLPPMPRFPGDMPPPPHFMGDGPWHPRFPPDMPRFRMPHHSSTVPLKMSNLSFHVTQEDILEFFMKFSPIPESVRLMYNHAGKLTGDGMVTLTSREAADAAMKELDQKPLLGRKVKLHFA